MISIKIIISSLSSAAAITACAGGTYSLFKEKKVEEVTQGIKEEFTYVIASLDKTPIAQTNKETIEDLFIETKKNYKCKSGTLIDSSCEIYLLNLIETNKRAIDLKFLATKETKIDNKTYLNDQQYSHYILKIKKSKYESINSGEKTISIVSNKGNLFALLNLKYEIENTFETIKSNLAIVEALSDAASNSISEQSNYFCSLKGEQEVKCKLSKTTEELKLSELEIEKFQDLSKPKQSTEIKANNFYILELIGDPKLRSKWKSSTITISSQSNSETKVQVGTFKFNQLLIGEASTKPDLFFLKKRNAFFLVSVLKGNDGDNTKLIDDSKEKNYICKIPTSSSSFINDLSCEIYKVELNTQGQPTYLHNLEELEHLVEKIGDLDNKQIFLLKLDEEQLKINSEPLSVELISSTEPKKTYATLTSEFKFENHSFRGNSHLVIAKPVSRINVAGTGYKCQINGLLPKVCDVYKFSTDQHDEARLANFLTTSKSNQYSDIKLGEFFVFDLKDQTIMSGEEEPTIIVQKASDNSKLFELKDITLFAGNISEDPKKNQAIFVY